MKRFSKRILEALVLVLILVLIGSAGDGLFFKAARLNRPAKLALAEMHRKIQIGDSEAEVEETVARHLHERHRMRNGVLPGSREVAMPFELGAGDWVLHIAFDSTSKVSAVSMRTSDGIDSPPKGGPPDKGVFPR